MRKRTRQRRFEPLTCPGPAAALVRAAAELLSAAHASIRAAEARRHVDTLADDAFEGRQAGTRGGRAAAAYVVEQIAGLGLDPAGDGGTYYQSLGGMRNILALWRGSDPELARELVVVGAHYDHVGYGNAANSFGPFGFVHNGADDNASGVAGLVEIAEALVLLPDRPRRSILIAFWDGEEQGLKGSSHFLRVRPAPLGHLRPVFSLNLDMIGRLRDRRLEVFGTRSARGLRAAVVAANVDPANAAALELAFDWNIKEESDHYPFIAAGIPTVMLHTGLHDQYHRPGDDAHLVNADGIEPVARLALGFVVAVANGPGPPGPFRPECRSESEAARRALETFTAPAGLRVGRWGIVTRQDPGEPTAAVAVHVAVDSPAARGGLLAGDRILAIDGVTVGPADDLLAPLRSAGPLTTLVVERRGRILRIDMRLEAAQDGGR